MLTRITRYTLLVLCLLVAGVWGWSYLRCEQFNCEFDSDNPFLHWNITSENGAVSVSWSPDNDGPTIVECSGLVWSHDLTRFKLWRYPERWPRLQLPGVIAYFYPMNLYRNLHRITVSYWLIELIAVVLTMGAFYRPIRNRLRGKRDAGFAVEPKTAAGNERQKR